MESGGATTGVQRAGRNPRASPVSGRKRLSDITNLSSDGAAQRRYSDDNGKGKAAAAANRDAAYLAKLLMENTALMRALAERNIVIERLSQQNRQLAQENNHMLAERTLDKDRLRAFQHELGCGQAVLKIKTLELEMKTSELEEKQKLIEELRAIIGFKEVPTTLYHVAEAGQRNACITNKKRTARSQSLASSKVNHQLGEKVKNESSRKSLRRKTIGSKHALCDPTGDLFEIVDAAFPVLSQVSDPMSEDSPFQVQSASSVSNTTSQVKVKEEMRDQSASPEDHNQGVHRKSIGRPMRRAAEKVSSYREKPLNVKMRRSE